MFLLRKRGVKILKRKVSKSNITCGTWLVDHGNADLVAKGKKYIEVPVDKDWITVGTDESIIFLDVETGMWFLYCNHLLTISIQSGEVSLAVWRGICQERPDILNFIITTITEAIQDRRGVRVCTLIISYIIYK
jgi:hypothetical protein